MKLACIVSLAVAALLALPAAAQTASDMQILAQKIKADKKLVVAANMQLTEDEAKGFWPVYEAYQKDLENINQRLGGTIRSYAAAFNQGRVSDEIAKGLINESIAIEEAEAKLKRSYAARLEKVIPGVKVACYIQIENKIRAIVRYDLAEHIPLVR